MREDLDKKLADKGWQSMQQLLDRDMPTDRKRRPIVWWWLGMLMLPLAILGGRTWWQTETKRPPEHIPALLKTERPVVQHQTEGLPAESGNASMHSKGTTPAQTEKSVANTGSVALSLPVADRPAMRHASKTTAEVVQAAARTAPVSNSALNAVLTPAENTAAANTPEAVPTVAVPETQPATATTAGAARDFATALAPLEMPLQAVEKENTSPLATRTFAAHTAEEPVIHPQQANPRWAFGLSAAASTERFGYLNALSGGLTADVRFARKFGLRSSVLYTRYRPSPSRQPVVAVEEVQYSNATGLYTGAYTDPNGSPSNIYDTPEEEYVYIPLRKLHRMEMPVLAWWQPSRALRVYSGISMDYTFFGQSAKQNYIDNSLVTLDSYGRQKSASQVATEKLTRWQFQFQGGLGLRLGRHAELSAFWRAPLHNIFPQRYDLVSFNSSTEQFYDPSQSVNSNALPQISRFVLQGSWLF